MIVERNNLYHSLLDTEESQSETLVDTAIRDELCYTIDNPNKSLIYDKDTVQIVDNTVIHYPFELFVINPIRVAFFKQVFHLVFIKYDLDDREKIGFFNRTNILTIKNNNEYLNKVKICSENRCEGVSNICIINPLFKGFKKCYIKFTDYYKQSTSSSPISQTINLRGTNISEFKYLNSKNLVCDFSDNRCIRQVMIDIGGTPLGKKIAKSGCLYLDLNHTEFDSAVSTLQVNENTIYEKKIEDGEIVWKRVL